VSFFNILSEKIILPVSDLALNRKLKVFLSFLNESQYWTREQINSFQDSKLRELISYANSYIPYYRDIFRTHNIKPKEIRSRTDLTKIPVLTKEIIKREGIDRFTSTMIKRKDRLLSSSSGSTGEPLFYYNTKEAYTMNLAGSLRGWSWIGYRLGDKYIKLSQNARGNFIKRLQDKLSRNLYLSTNPLTDTNFDFILNEIERYKPKIIRSYPDPLLLLARYKQTHPEFLYKPIAIATTGNTLFPETRKEIGQTFGCKIFDAYNSEGNSTVFECPTHTCYHSAEEYGISEILNDEGNPVTSGTGRLVSTDLWNFAHPFIRYDTQDFVETDETPCKCGRSHLRINKILGRDNDILVMESGRKFIVHNFTGFFQVDTPQLNRAVDQFQVVKRIDSTILFRLVVNSKFNESVKQYIRKYWEEEFKTKVTVETVQQIPLSPVGKRRFIINE
jgi:phenylacetate-CoA ligase